MAKPSGQNTMKPITINAMVAGVQAGRINAVVFIFSQSFRWRQPIPAAWNRNGKGKTAIQDERAQNRTSG
ncbi:hypothetical protein MesoLj131a_05970 [Mesorhizobium sp. 131-2-1]|nr:hypothetical protein MesoLj131a_05970 [Mesorhizobium sp. 131-2-1]